MDSDPSSAADSPETDRVEDRQSSRLGSLLEAADIAGFRLRPDGTIHDVNDSFTSLTGYDREELRGTAFSAITTDDAPALESLVADGDSNPVSMSVSIRTKAGTSIACELHGERFESVEGERRIGGIINRRPAASATVAEPDLTYGKTFQALADAVPDGIIVLDTDSDVQYANPAVERILGYTPDELVGSSKVTIIPPRLRQDHLDALARYLETGERNLNWTYVELPGQHKAGYEVPLGVSLNDFTYNGDRYFVGLFRDITPRKETERTLRAKVVQLESVASLGRYALEAAEIDDVLENTVELVGAALGGDTCAVLESDSGHEADEEFDVRASVTAIEQQADAASPVAELAAVAEGALAEAGPVVVDGVASDPRVDETTFSGCDVRTAVAVPIGEPTEPWGVLATGWTDTHSVSDHDVDFLESVTTILATGIERQRYERRLSETIDKYEASNEQLEQFAYAASHDLQEPLRMVSSYLKLLEDRYGDELDDDAEEFIEYAVDGAERMKAMIDGLLEYSRIDTQGDPFEPVDLEGVVDDVVTDLSMLVDRNDAEITTESLPTVRGDPRQLRQLFQNLFSNAIQYSGAGPPRVHVTAEQTGSMWTVSVQDNGIGIDADDPEAVFGIFQRIHSSDAHDGTGIGLALCRRIVERHGGTITVDTEPTEGSVFRFTLPPTDGQPHS